MKTQKFIHLLLLGTILAAMLGTNPASASQSGVGPNAAVLAKVYFHSEQELGQLATELDLWEVHHPQGYVLALLYPAEITRLRSAGWQVEISPESTASLRLPSLAVPFQLTGIQDFPCYRTIDETYARMQALPSLYPNLVQTSDIGDSWEKVIPGGTTGYDINVLKLTNTLLPGPKPKFFLMAEIHARELTTAETALRFAEFLLQNYGVDPDITWLLDYFEVDIVPMTNPDGRKQVETNLSSYWRKNTDSANSCLITNWPDYGTDLNRNSSYGWGGAGASSYACEETYRGPAAASEPEVKAIQTYVANLFPSGTSPTVAKPAPSDSEGLFITLHSYDQLVLWSYGASPQAAPNQTQLQTLGRKLAYFNGYFPEQSYDLYPTSGTTDDWAYGTLGVPAYTIEMGSEFYETCESFDATVWPENRAALLYAFKAARRPYQTPAGPEITAASVTAGPIYAGASVTLTAAADSTRSSTANGSEPIRTIQSARASIDTPSWINGTSTFSLSAADGNFNTSMESLTATINTSNLAVGRHTLFMEAQDSAGNWGVPTAAFLTISPLPVFKIEAALASSQVKGLPGRQVQFSLTITNQGDAPDVFDLSATNSASWEMTLSSTHIGPLQHADTQQISVSVTIPPEAAAGTTVSIQFTARSQGDPSVSVRVPLELDVLWAAYLSVISK